MRWLRESTAINMRIGPFLDATDGVTEEVGLTPATRIAKHGASFVAGPSGVHDEDGWYSVSFTTSHTNTQGSLVLKSQDPATHLPVWHEFMVIPATTYDSLIDESDRLRTDVTQWLGTTVSTPTVAGVPEVDVTHMEGGTQTVTDLKDFADAGYDPATNKVQGVVLVDTTTANTDVRGTDSAALASVCTEARLAELDGANLPADVAAVPTANENAAAIGPQQNQAFSDLEFLMVLSSDGQTPATGLTVTGERSLNGGAFAAVTGTIAEVSDGIYQIDASAADMNAAIVTLRFSSATALDTFITIKTTPA